MAYTITAAPLPTNFRGTPQELLEAFLDRLEITSDVVGFIVSDSEPNPPLSGPSVWLKNGQQIWVWDEEVEGGSFIPLDVTASVTPQIWVGPGTVDPVTPDTALYSIWLKVVNGAVEGLFYWNGTAWVTQPIVIADGTVTTAMLADNSVTTNKIKAGAVTTVKLAGNIPMSKWEKGPANYYVRMSAGGTEAQWRAADTLPAWIEESALVPLTEIEGHHTSDYFKFTFTHTLGTIPRYVNAVLRCNSAELGYTVGQETEPVEVLFTRRTSTEITVFVFGDAFNVIDLRDVVAPITYASQPVTVAKWDLKIYYAKGIQ